ncbi:MAG TPA: hypothetical protein VGF67_00410 [Ktedonobacteraceae bacterium]
MHAQRPLPALLISRILNQTITLLLAGEIGRQRNRPGAATNACAKDEKHPVVGPGECMGARRQRVRLA